MNQLATPLPEEGRVMVNLATPLPEEGRVMVNLATPLPEEGRVKVKLATRTPRAILRGELDLDPPLGVTRWTSHMGVSP